MTRPRLHDRAWTLPLAAYLALNATARRTTCHHIRQGIGALGPAGAPAFIASLAGFAIHVLHPMRKAD